jgi:hypothetical protein
MAIPCTPIPQNKKRRRTFREAFTHVWTIGFLADRVNIAFSDNFMGLLIDAAGRNPPL